MRVVWSVWFPLVVVQVVLGEELASMTAVVVRLLLLFLQLMGSWFVVVMVKLVMVMLLVRR